MTELSFDRLLERCLQEVARTGDLEAVLQAHPRQADQLRPLLEVALAARRHYADVPQPPGGLAGGRARFMDAAARQRTQANAPPTRRERRQRMRLGFAAKLVGATLAFVLGTTAVGSGIAWAAGDTIPGDTLYPMKLAVEDLRLALASGPEIHVRLALQFVEQRALEIQGLVEAGEPVPEEVAARMEHHIQYALQWAAAASDEEMPGLLARVAQRTQTQAQVLERVRAMAPEEAQEGLQHAQQICLHGSETAMAALGDPHTFRWRYQNREGTPDEVEPPEPPTVEPPGGQGEPQGPNGPDQTPECTPPGDQEREQQRDQERDQQQDQECDQQQDQERERQRDQEGQPTDAPQGQQHQGEQGQGQGTGPQGGGHP